MPDWLTDKPLKSVSVSNTCLYSKRPSVLCPPPPLLTQTLFDCHFCFGSTVTEFSRNPMTLSASAACVCVSNWGGEHLNTVSSSTGVAAVLITYFYLPDTVCRTFTSLSLFFFFFFNYDHHFTLTEPCADCGTSLIRSG